MNDSNEPVNRFDEDLEPVENELDIEELLLGDLSNAVVQATDWTTETLLSQLEKGRIQLNPRFQRRDAWSQERKSKFIESLILGFPIPQLVLAEAQERSGRYIVIDGKQRLLSLVQFADYGTLPESFERLRLRGLTILNELNGKTFDEISSSSFGTSKLEEFENRTIRTVVVRHWEHDAILYHIFLRLNTGSVQLSPQELRNALHPGPFAEFIDTYSGESPALRRILNSDKPDFRMRDAELLLRYYAFRNFLSDYSGSMKRFLDTTTQRMNDRFSISETDTRKQASQFEDAVTLAYEIFGPKDTFRKWKDGEFIGRFNRAVYDVILLHFWKPDIQDELRKHAVEVKEGFVELSQTNLEFIDAIESTTKSLKATAMRLSLWTQTLNQSIGTSLPVPHLVKNRIVFAGQ